MKTKSNLLKNFCIAIFAFVALASCNSNSKQAELLKAGIHTVVVQEVIQTSQYTYLRLKEEGNSAAKEGDSLWVAVPSMESKNGETLYFKGGFPMKNFISKELNRTFKEVLFLDSLSRNPDFLKNQTGGAPSNGMPSADSIMTGAPKVEKIDVKIDPVDGGITIADLYGKKESYSGKSIKVKGQVTKFSPDIMGKNWIHIQDGTENNGKFDLTITTSLSATVGDVMCFEGKISLDIDLGYGYVYEILMEDAKITK